jgi:hypothetical protein
LAELAVKSVLVSLLNVLALTAGMHVNSLAAMKEWAEANKQPETLHPWP